MIPRQQIIDTIRDVYELFSFVPLDTTQIEYERTLIGDAPTDMQLYRLERTRGEEALALRFDLTVSLARFVAANWSALPHPFKRYQLGTAFRGERRQRGRFNSFLQFDADIIGSRDVLADFEVVSAMYAVMTELGVERFELRLNDRRVLNGLGELIGLTPSQVPSVIRSIDKLPKIGRERVMEELEILKLGKDALAQVDQYLRIERNDVAGLTDLVGSTDAGRAGSDDLDKIQRWAQALGMEQVVIDPSIARGLGYYTGPVFEMFLLDAPDFGAVYAGGRYDNLVNRFSSQSIPGTGASMGIDRFVEAMTGLDVLEVRRSETDVLIARFSPELDGEYLKLAAELRQAGVVAELYLDAEKFQDQLDYAIKQQIPLLVILGPDEATAGTVTLKDLQTRQQETIPQGTLVDTIKERLTRNAA